MIKEIRTGSVLGSFLTRVLFRDPDLNMKYEVPEQVNHFLQYKNHLPISITGPRDDLRVRGIYNHGFSFNDLAPPETRFAVSEFQDMVRADVENHQIIIPARKRCRDALVFGLFHAVGRLKVHEDLTWHEKSLQAHQLLNDSIAHLRAYGKVELPKSLTDKEHAIAAWRVVCQEEQMVSTTALQLIADLVAKGFDPIPQVRNVDQLAQLVNSHHLLRTNRQNEIDSRWTEKQIGITMTLTKQQIAEVLHV